MGYTRWLNRKFCVFKVGRRLSLAERVQGQRTSNAANQRCNSARELSISFRLQRVPTTIVLVMQAKLHAQTPAAFSCRDLSFPLSYPVWKPRNFRQTSKKDYWPRLFFGRNKKRSFFVFSLSSIVEDRVNYLYTTDVYFIYVRVFVSSPIRSQFSVF